MKPITYMRTGPQAMARADWGTVFMIADAKPEAPAYELLDGGVAVLSIKTPLASSPDILLQDYRTIEAQAEEAFTAPDVRSVLLRISSPGGDAAGCIELSRTLRKLSDETGKPLATFADRKMGSAAYAIGCAASLIVCEPSTIVGSVGAFEPIIDLTAKDAAEGLRVTFVTSGKYKVAGNPHAPTDETALATVGRQVGELSSLFFDLVAEMRGIPRADIEALEGEAFIGARAVDSRLVDRTGSFEELLSLLQSGEIPMAKAEEKKDEKKDGGGIESTLAALTALAESDDAECAAKAKKMLAAYASEGEEPKDEPKEEPKKESEGKSKSEDKDGDGAKAMLAMTQRIHALESERALEKEVAAKAKLLDTRKDFSAEVRASLEKLPLASVEEAVKTWKQAPGAAARAAVAASMAVPTLVGAGEGSPQLPPHMQESIDRAFGRPVAGMRFQAGVPDRAAARAHIEQIERARTAAGGGGK